MFACVAETKESRKVGNETISVNIVNDFMAQQCLSACRIISCMVMVMEMVIKIDKQGRLLLPKDIREKYHMVHDTDLVVTEESDGIKLSVKKEKKRLKDVFDNAPSFDPKKALVIDVANFDEDET